MDWLVVIVQWLHVLLGIVWLGNALVLDMIVIPAINRLPIVTQREVASLIGARATPLFHVVVPLIIVLGSIRGTFLGPIKSLDILFGTAYGLTWLVALLVTIATYLALASASAGSSFPLAARRKSCETSCAVN